MRGLISPIANDGSCHKATPHVPFSLSCLDGESFGSEDQLWKAVIEGVGNYLIVWCLGLCNYVIINSTRGYLPTRPLASSGHGEPQPDGAREREPLAGRPSRGRWRFPCLTRGLRDGTRDGSLRPFCAAPGRWIRRSRRRPRSPPPPLGAGDVRSCRRRAGTGVRWSGHLRHPLTSHP